MEEYNLVHRIKDTCEIKNISISQLERDLEFSPGLISRWDKSSPSADRIVAVAKYLSVSTDYILGLSEPNIDNDIANKFINKLIVKTNNLEIEWEEEGEITNDVSDILIKIAIKHTSLTFIKPHIYPIYTFNFNKSKILIANVNSIITSNDVYLLMASHNINNCYDSSSLSLLATGDNVKLLYNVVANYRKNGILKFKDKELMEMFINEAKPESSREKLKRQLAKSGGSFIIPPNNAEGD